MRRRGVLTLAALGPAAAAGAEAPVAEPPPGAALPLDLRLRDAAGHGLTPGEALDGLPALFAFADYDCAALCGTALGLAAATLPGTGLRPGRDYRLVVLGLDPDDGPAKAAAMRRAWLGEGTALAETARFLAGPATALARAEAALGYRALRQGDAILHPLALFALRADGGLAAMLPELGTTPAALRSALQAAARPNGMGVIERVELLCQGLAAGHAGAVQGALAFGGVSTLALLGGGLLLLRRRERRA
ncbi:thioredoxin domain-containing protein [Roseicella frigidaeris]|uniref:SCO family protein n=1 Tax=Roseicella frigidaeris TaxID=2230885 RepID=A0A327M6T8_9PROT|nr:SCO family protein [Roseicella frigidaeris]RAI58012.1 SCO family protein [Roseicella frigidaeris]